MSFQLPGSHLRHDRLFLPLALNDLMMQAVEGQLQTIGNAELVIDLAQIVLDDLLRCAQLVGDFLVALTLGDASDDRHLFRRKPWLGARADQRGSLRAVGLDDQVDRLVIDPGFATGNLAHTLDEKIRRNGPRNDAADASPIKLDSMAFL